MKGQSTSLSGSASFPDLRVLSPPEFGRMCVRCGLMVRQLPWQISINNCWGPVCSECGKTILLGLLRQLRGPFSEIELMNVFLGLGLGEKESELLFQDLQKEGTIRTRGKGFFLFDNEPIVEPICSIPTQPRRARKRAYRRLSSEQVFHKCVVLSREILNAEELH